jgi:hypothetical protein
VTAMPMRTVPVEPLPPVTVHPVPLAFPPIAVAPGPRVNGPHVNIRQPPPPRVFYPRPRTSGPHVNIYNPHVQPRPRVYPPAWRLRRPDTVRPRITVKRIPAWRQRPRIRSGPHAGGPRIQHNRATRRIGGPSRVSSHRNFGNNRGAWRSRSSRQVNRRH